MEKNTSSKRRAAQHKTTTKPPHPTPPITPPTSNVRHTHESIEVEKIYESIFNVIKKLIPYVTKDLELKSLNMLSNTRASTLQSQMSPLFRELI